MVLIKERIGKLLEVVKEWIYSEEISIPEYKVLKSKERFEGVADLNTADWDVLTNEELWGGHGEYFWFATTVTIPETMDGKCVVYELTTGREGQWDAINPQFTIYVNGKRRQGLDVNHRELILSENAQAGEEYHIVLSAFTGDKNFKLIMDSAIKVLDRKTEKYYYDLSVPYGVARLLRDGDSAYITIITALNESLNLLDTRKVYSKEYYSSLEKAQNYITEEFYEKNCGNSTESIYCVGHTHIDVAWLWTLAVTEDKSVRSFSTVLELMRQYPEYKFMSSQPQLYKYVKKNAPEIYEEIKERVAEGRWETEGGMFVEADCNISSGESLVRQFIHGKRFFKEEFNQDNEILWLPDVFGYSAALPQIMNKCNLKYFMTTKISWNEFNKMPCDTFEWEGIDGTRVLTHFIPSRDYNKAAIEGSTETEHFTTYNAYINPSQVKGAWERYSQKYLNEEVLMSFGFGDGGGGPTKDMLENQKRLAQGIPGSPKTIMSTSRDFFHKLDEKVSKHKYLPEWVGELYLEYHRGTYTSMARNKKFNRKSEFLFENVELFSKMNKELNQAKYPKEEIEAAWEVILRNQFHDILPGSSIKEVYDDSKAEYESIFATGQKLMEEGLNGIVDKVNAEKGSILVFNPNSSLGEGIVEFLCTEDLKDKSIICGEVVSKIQPIGDNKYIFLSKDVPSKGYKAFAVTNSTPTENLPLTGDTNRLENAYVKVEFDENGQISSIYDKSAKRQLLKENEKANVLMTYEDRPHNYDAWDLNNYYVEKAWEIKEAESITLVEAGPVRATIKVSRQYFDSKIDQYISLYADSSEIVIRNEIDWKESHTFMKSVFPMDIHTDEATYDIQYGNVKRKTHYNTSWDYAKFEVCMHKWLDISEDDYGVSVMNDCKYGCNVHDGRIGISMLKSATYPNPEADKEHHSFTFTIYPHTGDWKAAGTVKKAYQLNNPMIAVCKESANGSLTASYSQVSVDKENIRVEVVKEAMDSEAVVIRMYECYNRRSEAEITFARPIKSIYECNMLEENDISIAFQKNSAKLQFKPYEIKTLKVTF